MSRQNLRMCVYIKLRYLRMCRW